MSAVRILHCPADRRYSLHLDPSQCFPDDPGAGAPAMIYGPRGASGTYGCASDTGELDCGDHEMPPAVLRWLQSEEIEEAAAGVWS